MRKLLRLAGAVLVVFVLAADTPVSAAPPCDSVCTCSTKCSVRCVGPFIVTTCGEWGVCLGMCRAPEVTTAALPGAPQAEVDDALLAQILGQPGCGETAPAATVD